MQTLTTMTTDPRNVVSGASAASGVEAMSLDECHALLTRQRLAILCTVDGDVPYAVPMFYGFDAASGALVLGISEGHKTRVMDENPNVSVVVTEVGGGDAWRSVVVRGRAAWVTEPEERAEAVRLLMAHNRRPERQQPPAAGAQPSPARRHGGGRIMRVDDALVSGRAKS